MNNKTTDNTDFVKGDPMPYSRLKVLSQHIRDKYFEITNEGELQYDFTLPSQQGVNKVILHKMRLALLGYREEFPEVPDFAQRLRRMCTDHFRNKQAIFRRDPAVQATINSRHRRRSRKDKKLARRRKMLAQHRTSLEKEFPAVGMNILLSNKYMSDEESDDEDPLTRPISVLRPSYRSDIANRFLEKLDQLHVASVRVRRHQGNKMPRSVISVEPPVPKELPSWMKQ
ncbi:hypothetical protein BDC45DRAFT_119776 [Circinella umbellata]|nr:hypothetical protein BDC45DRAFT_119776 [Circinella umbellata]